MKKLIVAVVLFFIGLVIFMPKENLLSTLKSLLKKEHIEIVSKDTKDRLIDLKLDDTLFIYDGIESLEAKSISVKPWIFYNKIEANALAPTKGLRGILNVKADEFTITHSILKPTIANINATGKFGELDGFADLKKRSVYLLLKPSEAFKNSKIVRDYFKKSKEGLVYESNF